MIAAFLTSCVFLSCYLYYHAHVGSVHFRGQGWSRPLYFSILISSPVPATRAVVHSAEIPQRWMRAEPPFAKARTCASVAMVVSPGNDVRRAPCAHPSLRASSGLSPESSP